MLRGLPDKEMQHIAGMKPKPQLQITSLGYANDSTMGNIKELHSMTQKNIILFILLSLTK